MPIEELSDAAIGVTLVMGRVVRSLRIVILIKINF